MCWDLSVLLIYHYKNFALLLSGIISDWLTVALWDSPVLLEAGRVVTVKDVPPTVDVNHASGHRDK